MRRIQTFDTTLRDGTQGESVSFSVEDKLLILQKLDELGIDYVEGGWPGSNPKDREFFLRAKDVKLKHARLTAFGSTRFAKNAVHKDANVRELIDAAAPAAAIFGKSWDFHVERALGISLAENLVLIGETVAYLKQHGLEVIYDAEHFFDGYNANPDFALRTLEAAKKAGADVLCLCDTNGGAMPARVAEVVALVVKTFGGTIGIHTHNDSDVAVANSLVAVEAGAAHVQGCLNGYGERCGNANLASVIANLELKLGRATIGRDKLVHLAGACRFISELANLPLRNDQPYVGQSAFAHKGGMHVSAVMKDSATYEHVAPELVGNRQRVLLSDLSGKSNVSYKLDHYGLADGLGDEARRALLERIKFMEYEGYDFEVAEGTFELMVRQALNPNRHFFDLVGFDVYTKSNGGAESNAIANVIVKINGEIYPAGGTGHGPIDALHEALRKCLLNYYPRIADVRLTDYKVRVLDAKRGTAAKVRVLIEWSDQERSWTTVGISDDVIKASSRAMVDALHLELMRLAAFGPPADDQPLAEAHGWGV